MNHTELITGALRRRQEEITKEGRSQAEYKDAIDRLYPKLEWLLKNRGVVQEPDEFIAISMLVPPIRVTPSVAIPLGGENAQVYVRDHVSYEYFSDHPLADVKSSEVDGISIVLAHPSEANNSLRGEHEELITLIPKSQALSKGFEQIEAGLAIASLIKAGIATPSSSPTT